jgi:hypothetical protein
MCVPCGQIFILQICQSGRFCGVVDQSKEVHPKRKKKKKIGLCPLRLIRGNHTNTNVHNTSHWVNQYLSGPIAAIQCAILFNIIIIIWKHTNSRPDLTSHWHPQAKLIEQRADRSFTCTPLGLILGPYLWSQVPRTGVTPVSHACPMPHGPSPLGSKCHFELHLNSWS